MIHTDDEHPCKDLLFLPSFPKHDGLSNHREGRNKNGCCAIDEFVHSGKGSSDLIANQGSRDFSALPEAHKRIDLVYRSASIGLKLVLTGG